MCVCAYAYVCTYTIQWNRIESSETDSHDVKADTGKGKPCHELTLPNFVFEMIFKSNADRIFSKESFPVNFPI